MQSKQTKKRQANPETSSTEPTSYEDIRKIVLGWSPTMRSALAHDILDTLAQQAETPRPRRKTLHLALGLLDKGQPAPTDEEVEKMLDEYRMSKYSQ